MTDTSTAAKPRPLWIDQPIHRVQTIEPDGEREVVFEYQFSALNTGNERLLHDRENDIERVTLKLTKQRFRQKLPKEIEANRTFFCAVVRGGGFRPDVLPATVIDLASVPAEAHEIYSLNGDGAYHAGFFPLDVEEIREFDVERMEHGIERWFQCNGEVVASGRGLKDIEFMKARGGVITVRLLIGDRDAPDYRIKALFRRPDANRRYDFKDRFAYNVDHTKGEQGKIETVISLKEGIDFFGEHFIGISTEPDLDKDGRLIEYSEVVFTDTRSLEERMAAGEAPRLTSAVEPHADPGETDLEVSPEAVNFLPYEEALRSRFVAACHPMWKVEMSATAISSFQSANRE